MFLHDRPLLSQHIIQAVVEQLESIKRDSEIFDIKIHWTPAQDHVLTNFCSAMGPLLFAYFIAHYDDAKSKAERLPGPLAADGFVICVQYLSNAVREETFLDFMCAALQMDNDEQKKFPGLIKHIQVSHCNPI